VLHPAAWCGLAHPAGEAAFGLGGRSTLRPYAVCGGRGMSAKNTLSELIRPVLPRGVVWFDISKRRAGLGLGGMCGVEEPDFSLLHSLYLIM
jgi:hypothetical protein